MRVLWYDVRMFNYFDGVLSGVASSVGHMVQAAAGGVLAALLTVSPGLATWISPSLGISPVISTVCGYGRNIGNGMCRGYLTSGSSWTVPADWSNTNNTIDAIGGGGTGASGTFGGGGGAFARKTNVTLTPGSTVLYSVGLGGGGNTALVYGSANGSGTLGTGTPIGGDTWFHARTTLLAKGANGSTGGSAASSVGDLKYSGGNGSSEMSWTLDGSSFYSVGGGGGSAASMYGSPSMSCSGAIVSGANCTSRPTGTEYDATHGSGIGGGGGYSVSDGLCLGSGGYAAGLYGGGGGGAAVDPDCPSYVSSGGGGVGAQGLIVIVYAHNDNTQKPPPPVVPPPDTPIPPTPPDDKPDPLIDPSCQSYLLCNASGTKVVNSCTGAVVEDCTAHGAGWYCSGSACTVHVVGFEDFDATSDAGPFHATGHLEVMPRLVSKDSRVRLYWNAVNAQSCTVTGTNSDSWSALSSGSKGQLSSPITGRTTYTLFCRAYEGATPATITEQIVVNIVPVFQEQ